jgi:hypothetical protein
MGDVVDADREHLRLLKIGFYILTALCGLGSLAGLIFLAVGGFVASGAISAHDGDASVIGWVFPLVGWGMLVGGGVFTFLTWQVAQCLAEYRSRTFCMVMAALWCLHMPLGTIVGVFALVVLSRPSVQALFDRGSVAPLPLSQYQPPKY